MRFLCALVLLSFVTVGCAAKSQKRGLSLSDIDQPTCDPLFDRVCMPKQTAAKNDGTANR